MKIGRKTYFSTKRWKEQTSTEVRYFILKSGSMFFNRKIGPALIEKYILGWAKEGKYHRIDGPSFISKEHKQLYKEWHFEKSKHISSEETYWNK